MNIRRKSIAFTLASLVAASGIAVAADTSPAKGQPPGGESANRMDMNGMMHDGMSGMMRGNREQPGGMMHGGMMGMMDMMGACGQMMNGRSPMSAMARLPAGNEKLQLQMQAEMMQKMGEILSSYAARLPDTPGSAR